MTAASPAPERRRPRPGSLERPVNGRLYRGTWLLVGLPLLLLAFSVARPPALTRRNLPPAFDASQAASIAKDLAADYPDRRPGTLGARSRSLVPRAAQAVRLRRARRSVHGHDRRPPDARSSTSSRRSRHGISPREIVVMAHRDDSGTGSGLERQRLGHGGAIELARSYAPTAAAQRISLPYSTRFRLDRRAEEGSVPRTSPRQQQARGTSSPSINLDSIGGAAVLGSCSAATRPVRPRPDSSRRCVPRSRRRGRTRAVAAERASAARQPRRSPSIRTSRRRSSAAGSRR